MGYSERKKVRREVRLWAWPATRLWAADPLGLTRLRTLLVTKLLEASDRFFERLPLQADRYDRRFLFALGGVLGFLGAAYWALPAYWHVDWFAREDRVVEWVSVAMFAAAAVMAAVTARSLVRLRHPRLGLFHLVLAVAILLTVLEEISWGQRLFGWSTPGLLGGVNEQDETNLHNIPWIDQTVYTALLWGCFVALAGVAVRAVLHRHGRVTTADLILPSVLLSPALLMVAVWTGDGEPFRSLKSLLGSRPEGSEFPELILGFFLLLYTYANLKRAGDLRGRDRGPTSGGGKPTT